MEAFAILMFGIACCGGFAVISLVAGLYSRCGRIEKRLNMIASHIGIPDGTELSEHVKGLLRHGDKIMAIKVYRDESGLGLKEAKDAVEDSLRTEGLQK